VLVRNPEDEAGGSTAMTEALVERARQRMMVKLIGGLTAVMVLPPVLAGVFGTLGLAVVVGILAIFSGLLGMSLVVSKWEFFQRRVESSVLPKARLVERN
jgi:hypothetical protein